MHCYCANYYGSVNCQNKVAHFGQRCKLCTVLNEGHPAKVDLFKITSNDYAYDSEAADDDDSSPEKHGHERTRDHSKNSSK
ncbi:hypothetical protein F4813DRAFT_344434 [Daldinia decipiens]|uniref:uncharacterized protein n=1 Tax=Daldinia decipiens TaxID=326647 RepID=UPI0020C3FB9C|nr:uncharacterized protein F4813DRAFT_344434 [Daldinia decipiens]KAI1662407.1 hypothetical protein F4813DRAFT_344434 [Daldinia decipiens]